MKFSITAFALCLISFQANGAITTISGKVEKLRLHQMLDNSHWDGQVWFCLDTTEVVSGCGVTSECGNKNSIMISKDAPKEVYSSVLAARLSNHPISVQLDDTHKFGDHCYARVIDL